MAITTNFGADSAFGKVIDKDLEQRQNDLNQVSTDIQGTQTQLGTDEAAIIKGTTKDALANVDVNKSEIKRIADEYKASVAERRKQAEDLVNNQRQAAGLEANIAAAAGSEGGKLSVGQLASINKDITNQFATSINNAQKDNINFQTSLDDKLSSFGLSIVDKNKILDEFKKSLLDEEAAPLLDALAATATTKIDFIKKLGDAIDAIHKDEAEAKSGAQARDFRVEGEQQAFDNMDVGNKERYLSDKFGNTWSTLSSGQRNEILQKGVSGAISLSEINSIITNMQDKAEQAKLIQQQAAAGSETNANQALLETGIQTTGASTFSNPALTNSNTNTNNTLGSKTNPEPVKKTTGPASTGYKVGNVTYKDKASYDMLKKNIGAMTALQKSDPAAFAKAVELIKQRYIL